MDPSERPHSQTFAPTAENHSGQVAKVFSSAAQHV
jgi:hypothetical protein